jgi:hypothetical protein
MLKRATILILLTGALLTTACASRTINEVLADPGKYRNKEVKLTGSVVSSFSVVGTGAYRLDDRTGQLWIVSDHGVPREGARVSVKGTVREGFNLGALGNRLPAGLSSGIVMIESSHQAQ